MTSIEMSPELFNKYAEDKTLKDNNTWLMGQFLSINIEKNIFPMDKALEISRNLCYCYQKCYIVCKEVGEKVPEIDEFLYSFQQKIKKSIEEDEKKLKELN